ncbi:metallophosphoesterase family protein [Bacteroidota bacterium]
MNKIGLLSDTHGYIDKKIINFFSNCTEIWHAGDIGNIGIVDELSKICTFRGVHGNSDGNDVRVEYKKHNRFLCEDIDVWITHIGGYPGNYSAEVKSSIFIKPPKLFISGHSHILKVMNDKKLKLLHINPGAAGNQGIHSIRTAVRFNIDKNNISELEILEIPR